MFVFVFVFVLQYIEDLVREAASDVLSRVEVIAAEDFLTLTTMPKKYPGFQVSKTSMFDVDPSDPNYRTEVISSFGTFIAHEKEEESSSK